MAIDVLTITIAEAAAALRVSKRTIYRLIASGDLKTCDVATRGRPRLRVPADELKSFLKVRKERVS